ncbi:MAG: PIN domain-containing protein [Rhizobiaceae bacterium]|nr:PIN domain-containing protein [Rhizobiaceae bacterium]
MKNEKIEYFLDSNVLIYAASMRASRDPHRSPIAERLVLGSVFATTGQIMAEFASVCRRKHILTDDALDRWIMFLSTCPSLPVDDVYVRAGVELARRFRINYFDAALLAAAERLGAPVFYTEDLNHNQVYGSVRAVNPFL